MRYKIINKKYICNSFDVKVIWVVKDRDLDEKIKVSNGVVELEF